jgi:hypothetical protein
LWGIHLIFLFSDTLSTPKPAYFLRFRQNKQKSAIFISYFDELAPWTAGCRDAWRILYGDAAGGNGLPILGHGDGVGGLFTRFRRCILG